MFALPTTPPCHIVTVVETKHEAVQHHSCSPCLLLMLPVCHLHMCTHACMHYVITLLVGGARNITANRYIRREGAANATLSRQVFLQYEDKQSPVICETERHTNRQNDRTHCCVHARCRSLSILPSATYHKKEQSHTQYTQSCF